MTQFYSCCFLLLLSLTAFAREGSHDPTFRDAPTKDVYWSVPGIVEGEEFSAFYGIQTEPTADSGGGANVGYQDHLDFVEYLISPEKAGNYDITFRVAAAQAGARFLFSSPMGALLVIVPNTGAWQNWTDITLRVRLQAGAQTIRITTFDASWNLNRMTFALAPAPAELIPVPGRIEAEAYSSMKGVQKEPTSDEGGGQNVGYIDPGDWMQYEVEPDADARYHISFRVATPDANSVVEVQTSNGRVLLRMPIPVTGGFQDWETISADLYLSGQALPLRLVSTGTGHWNINWVSLQYFGAEDHIPAPARIEAESYTDMLGVQKEPTSDTGGGENVGYIDLGDGMHYRLVLPVAGMYPVSFRVATQEAGAEIEIAATGTGNFGFATLPRTGGWQQWQTVTAWAYFPAGPLEIVLRSKNDIHWNLNWFEVGVVVRPFFVPIPARIEAEDYWGAGGVHWESTADIGGGTNLGFIDPGDFMEYQIDAPATGDYILTLRLASAHAHDPRVAILDELGNQLAVVNVPYTGWWQTWTSVSVPLQLAAGRQRIRLRSVGAGSWNINWIEFSQEPAAVGIRPAAGSRQPTDLSPATGSALFPNPANGSSVTLSLNSVYAGPLDVQILDASGRAVNRYRISKGSGRFTVPLDISTLRPGVYYLVIREGDKVCTLPLTRM